MNKAIDLNELIKTYSKHWLWFLVMGILGVILATVYLRYQTPRYSVLTKIQLLEEDNGGGISIFEGSDLFNVGRQNVLDEVQLIKSRSNFIEIVETLDLNIRMSVIGNIRNSELYFNKPVNFNFIAEDSIINKTNFTFYLKFENSTSFRYSEEKDQGWKQYSFGNPLSSPIGEIVITPNLENIDKHYGKTIEVHVTPVDLIADIYRNNVEVVSDDDDSKVLDIRLSDAIPNRAKLILDQLVYSYNRNAIDDKKRIADRTRDFINDRISDISTNLTDVDQSAEELRLERGITDTGAETSTYLNVGASNRRDLADAQNRLNIAQGVKDLLDQREGFESLPANLGLNDPSIASATNNYNQLVLERERLLKSSNEKNPVIVNLDEQLQEIKNTLKASLNNTVNNLGLTVNNLSGQQAIINSRLYSAPSKERALRDISRKQQTTEQLYLYLLQKREEAQIAVASTTPKCKVIDSAFLTSRKPIAPRKKTIYLAAVIFSLLIPFSIIYLRDLLDNKVHNMRSMERLVPNTPILGELPKLTRKQIKFSLSDDRSVLSESLRIIRTNLDYLIKTNQSPTKKNNIVYVTSSISGEGKTFFSSNLALILASAQKKVLLLGADVRNPKIFDFFSSQKGKGENKMDKKSRGFGFTDYLFDSSIEYSQIVKTLNVNSISIDVIYSGRIPPNPAELLLSPKIPELIQSASEDYDYVIVDTAPLMVVTDTLLIAPYADHLIYVTRAEVTEEKAIEFPIKLQEEGKIKGLAFVVNDVVGSNLGYGGLYGYGYGKKKRPWWSLRK